MNASPISIAHITYLSKWHPLPQQAPVPSSAAVHSRIPSDSQCALASRKFIFIPLAQPGRAHVSDPSSPDPAQQLTARASDGSRHSSGWDVPLVGHPSAPVRPGTALGGIER